MGTAIHSLVFKKYFKKQIPDVLLKFGPILDHIGLFLG